MDSQSPTIDRFSPVYCRYNGFLLGQFLGVAFAEFARPQYAIHRARMQEFLDEVEAGVELPVEPLDFGDEPFQELVARVIDAVSERSQELGGATYLGYSMIIYGHFAESDPDAASSVAQQITRIAKDLELPPVPLEQLIVRPRADGVHPIDDVLSPALGYLKQAIDALPIENDTAFVIMPFKPPYTLHFSALYRAALEEAGLRAFRAWGGLSNEDYCELLLALIAKTGFVFADLSEANPNVLYEIGAAHALGKPTLLVIRDDLGEDVQVPSNVGRDPVLKYSPGAEDFPEGSMRLLAMMGSFVRLAAERNEGGRVRPQHISESFDHVIELLRESGVVQEE